MLLAWLLLPPPHAAPPPRRAAPPRCLELADPPPPSGIVPVVLHEEMRASYMSYALSVIMSRALPDARDGLKPVHRRILYAMHALNLQPDTPHRKCARVVGEVLGKFHPHGDGSVYDALVRMAQPFSLRAPLVDGHGNFGSIDPDPAAAMRYTECRLAPLARDALLADVAEDVVDFVDNFDVSEVEPAVLPARLPMLLLNGATGIAVGMATNCPPHNLAELVDVLRAYLRDPQLTDDALFELLPAPDFPGGGTIMGLRGVREMYLTGRGSIVLRAKAHVETLQKGRGPDREAIVVSELPHGVAKNMLLERIAALVNEKKVEGIAEIRDESSMEGLRVIFEVKRDADAAVVLNNLYKRTALQQTFAANLMAVVGSGRMPELLTLRAALAHFVDFRVGCLRRRTAHRLAKAEARLHVVGGLLLALERMDGVIAAIRAAPSLAAARAALGAPPFSLSEAQAEALLALQLRRLTALEAETLAAEAAELQAQVEELRALLADRRRVEALMHAELEELKARHATPRRTMIGTAADAELSDIDLTPDESCIVIRSSRGYVKRLLLEEFEAQNRGTRGKAGMSNLRDSDAVVQVLSCSSHATVLCISQRGVAYALPAYKVPASSRSARGVTFQQLLPISEGDTIETLLPVTSFSKDVYLVLLTRNGWIKKTALDAFQKISARGLYAISLEEGDLVVRAALCTVHDSVMLSSRRGQAIRFPTTDQQLRGSGRTSRGVKSMRMRDDDKIVDMQVVQGSAAEEKPRLLVAVTRCGFGKRMDVSRFGTQGRGGKGMIATKFKRPDDELVALSQAYADDQVLLITQKGTILRQTVSDISAQGRATTGVQLQRLDPDDYVASVAIVPSDAYETEGEEEEGEE